MCGLLGVYGDFDICNDHFFKALKLQSNRGPDNLGTKVFDNSILGHARLSIHDLSSAANQPMSKFDEQYTLLFNGEIYNFREVKDLLIPKYSFSTDSDTEVLIYSLIEFGLEDTLSKIKGMFAFSFHNRKTGDVYIARDRHGEKPLYYTHGLERLVVSSSLYSIVSLNGFYGLNTQSLSNYLHYGYCKNEESIATGINKLPPSSYIKYNSLNHTFILNKYEDENNKDAAKIHATLDQSIRNSVNACLDADVPVGCFLSGGVDSSLIASYIAELNVPVTAYSIGFTNKDYDESAVAQIVANHLGIKLKTKILDDSDFIQLINETEWVFDEPFADASYLAMYALSQFARKDVTVCLSGDAGDELFSGYNRHKFIPKIYASTHKIPYFIRKGMSTLLSNSDLFRATLKFTYEKLILKGNKITALDEKLDKFSTIIAYKDKDDLLYRVLAGNDYSTRIQLPIPFKHTLNSLNMRSLSELDLDSYLHEDILTKVDRCSMASSLEARVPFLDVDVVNYALNTKDEMHFSNGKQKVALRDLLSEKVPDDIINRPKSGFSVPYKDIVDNHLKDKFATYKIQFSSDFPIEYKQFERLFDVVDSYYNGNFKDYKFVWNIFFFFRWMNNINKLRSI